MVRPSHLLTPTRRGLLLGSAATFLSRSGLADTPSCSLTAEQEEGPYYVDGAKLRRDLTEGKPGVPVKLRVVLVDSRSCRPLSGAALDIWHCDASGVYSGFTSMSPDGMGGGRGPRAGGPPPDGEMGFRPGMPPPPGFGPGGRGPRKIDETRFLRGVQTSDAQGLVEFTTLYPGWYAGRAIHIHLKAHLGGEYRSEIYRGGHVAHTGQLFFPEDLTADIAKLEPYAKRLAVHRTTQDEDQIFRSQRAAASMLRMERVRSGSNAEGFVATVTLAIDPEATPSPVNGRGPMPGRGR